MKYRELDNNAHSVFLLHYHLVMVVKYRRKVIDDTINSRLKEIFEYIAPNYNITLEEWNYEEDHVHVLFRAHPNTELSKFINAYTSMVCFRITSRQKFSKCIYINISISIYIYNIKRNICNRC